MALLGVNIDHVATVRQARRTDEPDPVWAAIEAELGGADGITFHLREDRRHINDRDARVLKETVRVKLNMEMAVAEEVVRIAELLRPDQCTLVPERREELTTEGGLDVIRHRDRVRDVVVRLHNAGIVVSAFIEPIEDQINTCAEVGVDAVELWTGRYAHAHPLRSPPRSEPRPQGSGPSEPQASACANGGAPTKRSEQWAITRVDDHGASQRDAALHELRRSIEIGQNVGLEVHGGHGLTYRNIAPVAALAGFGEFNIGHSIVSRAIFVGMRNAVREMKDLIARHAPE